LQLDNKAASVQERLIALLIAVAAGGWLSGALMAWICWRARAMSLIVKRPVALKMKEIPK